MSFSPAVQVFSFPAIQANLCFCDVDDGMKIIIRETDNLDENQTGTDLKEAPERCTMATAVPKVCFGRDPRQFYRAMFSL